MIEKIIKDLRKKNLFTEKELKEIIRKYYKYSYSLSNWYILFGMI